MLLLLPPSDMVPPGCSCWELENNRIREVSSMGCLIVVIMRGYLIKFYIIYVVMVAEVGKYNDINVSGRE